MGIIALSGMHFYAKHGYFAHEKDIGTRYSVDVYISTDLQKAGISDNLNDTINYESIYSIVSEIMKTSVNLIEHLAYRIINEIAENHGDINRIRVRVTKDKPPLKGDVDSTYVEIEKQLHEKVTTDDGYWERRAKY